MTHIAMADSLTNLCLYFYIGNTVHLDMKAIGRRFIPYKDLSNSHFQPSFYCSSEFLASSETSDCRSTSPIPSLYQSVLMLTLIEVSSFGKVGSDKYMYLTIPLTFGPLDSIGCALVSSPPFEIVSLVEADLTRCTPRV